MEEKKKWLDEQRGRQERHPKTDAPVIFVHQIVQEKEVGFCWLCPPADAHLNGLLCLE